MTVLYAWKNNDWNRWFYVGVGTRQRAYDKRDRSNRFKEIVSSFDCAPHVLCEFPDNAEPDIIEKTEKTVKHVLITLGEPITDGENPNEHRSAVLKGIAIAKAEGKYKGRKPIEVDEAAFTEQYRAWKNDETSPKFAAKKLGISRATFYRRVEEYEKKHGIKREEK